MPDSVAKYRVTMVNEVQVTPELKHRHEAVDYVPIDILDGYVQDARTRWADVTVSETPESEGK